MQWENNSNFEYTLEIYFFSFQSEIYFKYVMNTLYLNYNSFVNLL